MHIRGSPLILKLPLQGSQNKVLYSQSVQLIDLDIQTIQQNIGGVKFSMSPRPYRLGQRQAATEQTRIRIINAARELLMANDGFSTFSIDVVARRADVARMTVYHQFGSKLGLLEALCDSLAMSGGMEQLSSAFRQGEPLASLNEYISVFSRFWDVDRLVMRRLRALAALDPDFEQVIRTRDEWRRKGLHVIVRRFVEQYGRPAPEALDEVIAVLYTLIGFEFFDTLAGPTRSIQEVVPVVQQLAYAAMRLNEEQLTSNNREPSRIPAERGENEGSCL
jgi:AcrR family transcriptional regulator